VPDESGKSWQRAALRRPFIAGFVLFAIAVVIYFVATEGPQSTAGPCTLVGNANLRALPEASGLAISRSIPGVVWSHNDSDNDEFLFGLDATGAVVGHVRVPVKMRDWEDVSAAACAPATCLYLADIGDNAQERTRVQIHRVPEPALGDAQTAAVQTFTASYADGPHNAEAMFVLGTDMFIITRDQRGGVYRAPAILAAGGDIVFRRIGQLNLPGVSDAEATPDEKSVAVRTTSEVRVYSSEEILRGNLTPYLVIPIRGLNEPQGEGVAMDEKGMLYLASEAGFRGAGSLLTLRCRLGQSM